LPSAAANIPRSNNFLKSFVEIATFYTEIKINGVFFILLWPATDACFMNSLGVPAGLFLFPALNKNKCGAAGGGEGGLLISLFY
jgi:hypothetical protein